MTRATILFPLLLAACADAKPPEAPPEPTSTPAPTAAATAAPAERLVSARVASRSPSPESAAYTRVNVVFSNPTSKACGFTGYTLRWPGGSKTYKLEGFQVPAGETRERIGKVNPNDDGYAALDKVDVANIGVEVVSDCAAEAPLPVPEAPPDPDAELLRGKASDTLARLAIGGVEIVAVIHAEKGSAPALTLATVQGGKVTARRDGWGAATGLSDKPSSACDTWHVSIVRQPFGARVNLVCAVGEDYKTAEETAVLLREGTLDRLWAGPANRAQNEMDSCFSSRTVEFSLKGKSLEKAISEETRWTDQPIAGDTKARLKKGCKVGKNKRVERVTIN